MVFYEKAKILILFSVVFLSFNILSTECFLCEMKQGNDLISITYSRQDKFYYYISINRFFSIDNQWIIDRSFGKSGKVKIENFKQVKYLNFTVKYNLDLKILDPGGEIIVSKNGKFIKFWRKYDDNVLGLVEKVRID